MWRWIEKVIMWCYNPSFCSCVNPTLRISYWKIGNFLQGNGVCSKPCPCLHGNIFLKAVVFVFDSYDWSNIALRRWLWRVGPVLTRQPVSHWQSEPSVLRKLILWKEGRMWSGWHQAYSHINSYNSWRFTTSRLCGEGLQANGTSKLFYQNSTSEKSEACSTWLSK